MHGPNDPVRPTAVSAVRRTPRTAVSVNGDGASSEFVTLTTLRTDTDSYVRELRPHALTSPVLLAPRPFQRWMFLRQRKGGHNKSAVKSGEQHNGRIPDEGINESFIEYCGADGK